MRIVGIVDVFSALTKGRANREEYATFDALKLMSQQTGALDPDVFKAFLKLLTHKPTVAVLLEASEQEA